MKVECFPKEGKREILTLYVEGEPHRDIHTDIFGQNPQISVSSENPQHFEEQFLEIEYAYAKKYVVKRLAVKSYPSFELIKMLEERLVTYSTTQKIIEKFENLGYLDDAYWIENFVRQQTERNHGPQKIAMKLRAKGVPEERIRHFFENVEDSEAQTERILQLIQTRYYSRDLSRYQEKQKVIAALMRKGFDFEHIHQALSFLKNER